MFKIFFKLFNYQWEKRRLKKVPAKFISVASQKPPAFYRGVHDSLTQGQRFYPLIFIFSGEAGAQKAVTR